MPEYTYECQRCGHQFSLVCSITEHEPSPPCPKCGDCQTEQTWYDGKAPEWSIK